MKTKATALLMALFYVAVFVFAVHADPIPSITEAQKKESINVIMDSGEVVRAHISQKGKDVSLTIIADAGILVMGAKKLALGFVRAVKIYSPDLYQGEQALGTGVYNYRVTVRDVNEKKDLVVGVKMADQSDLAWTFPKTESID